MAQTMLEPTPKINTWLDNRVQYIKGLKKPASQQVALVELASRVTTEAFTFEHERKLKILVKAERGIEQAEKARAEFKKMEQADKLMARKQRDHELYQVAGLLIKAGLVDAQTGKSNIDKGELLGALAELAQIPADQTKRREWKQIGDALLKA